ncbi:MAG: ribosome silencing factor [Candidatus Omnitrophica bacterium]|nr:ribosome silencing factor [Candidatus Omnitrophota bacterium]
MALAIAGAASDKKALDIIIVKMKKMSSVCDYFVIASGTSTTHVRALSDNIIKQLKERGQPLWHSEGEREASWILLDFGDVVCHLFLEDTREFYNLEDLWKKAPQERFKEPKPKTKPKKKKRIIRKKKTKKR